MAILLSVFHILKTRSNKAERLGKRVSTILLHRDHMAFHLAIIRNITQERYIGALLHIHPIVNGGIHHIAEQHDGNRDGQANQDTDQRSAFLIGSHRTIVRRSIVDDFTRSLQLGTGHHQLLAFGQQIEVQLFLDVLHTCQRLELHLGLRNSLDLRVGNIPFSVGSLNTILQAHQIGFQNGNNAGMKRNLLFSNTSSHWVVHRAVRLILLNLHQVIIVFGDD